ncbi:hypothetical protein Tco_0402868 [Tanacetum coccineum]
MKHIICLILVGQEKHPTEFATVIIVPADSLNSIPADNVPAGSSSNVPADYVSAGYVLVPADRDRIC